LRVSYAIQIQQKNGAIEAQSNPFVGKLLAFVCQLGNSIWQSGLSTPLKSSRILGLEIQNKKRFESKKLAIFKALIAT
jgi:hypothetical protein